MEITRDRLLTQFAAEATPRLLARLAEGGLTPEAEQLLVEELRKRGYRDRDAAARAAAELPALDPRSDPGRGPGPRASAGWALRAVGVAALLLGVAIGPVTRACAPFVWRSPDDRACQKAGYWYAEEDGTESTLHCGSW